MSVSLYLSIENKGLANENEAFAGAFSNPSFSLRKRKWHAYRPQNHLSLLVDHIDSRITQNMQDNELTVEYFYRAYFDIFNIVVGPETST